MSELKKQRDITKKTEVDKEKKDKTSDRGSVELEDMSHADAADKSIKLEGTEEGAQDIAKGTSDAMDNINRNHEQIDREMEELAREIEAVEKNFDARMKQTEQDAGTIKNELGKMKSKETGKAQQDMGAAINAAKEDARFMGDASAKEKDTRIAGKKEMGSQKNRLKGFKPRRR